MKKLILFGFCGLFSMSAWAENSSIPYGYDLLKPSEAQTCKDQGYSSSACRKAIDRAVLDEVSSLLVKNAPKDQASKVSRGAQNERSKFEQENEDLYLINVELNRLQATPKDDQQQATLNALKKNFLNHLKDPLPSSLFAKSAK